MKPEEKELIKKMANFDVIAEDIEKCAQKVKDALMDEKYKKIKLIKHANIQDIIPECIEIKVGSQTMAYIYKPIACHSYNKITVNHSEINIATIDTILTFYLAFLYVNDKKYNIKRLICMANLFYELQQRNRLEYSGILKRFSIKCYGKQDTMEEIRAYKALKYRELSHKRNSIDYQRIFLKYIPSMVYESKRNINKTEKNKDNKTQKNHSSNDNFENIFDLNKINQFNLFK
jgi:hypothetical protein